MTDLRKAAEQALEALVLALANGSSGLDRDKHRLHAGKDHDD